jgi:proline iminopeptidase
MSESSGPSDGAVASDVQPVSGVFPDLPARLVWPEGERFAAADGHHIWWAEGGDPQGHPVAMLHGGPGGRSRVEALGWWHGLPVRWIVIDQRGCGRSTPAGATQANTLAGLLDDLDHLRRHLGLQRWALAGGSWGAVVALSSLLRDPHRVQGLFLRSPFLATEAELERYLAPWDAWLGEAGRGLLGDDATRLPRWLRTPPGAPAIDVGADTARDEARLAQAWAGFDDLQSQPGGVAAAARCWEPPARSGEVPAAWRVFSHYARHGWFLQEPLLRSLQRLPPTDRGGPLAVLCGARDACCDPAHGGTLEDWRDSPQTLRIEVPDGGHRMDQPAMSAALQRLAAQWVAQLSTAA